MRREWVIPSRSYPEASALAETLGVPPLIGQLLCQRGWDSTPAARRFLACDLDDLHDPFQLTDMKRAVERLAHAITAGERICVVSDYDVDGLTSTALLVHVLRRLGASPITYVPHRVKDGYGFSRKAVASAKQRGARVVITVDSGSTAHAELAYAREQGLDVIVVDHHELGHLARPPALCLINPLQTGDPYPDKDLASVGLAFKLAQALLSRVGSRYAAWEHLDLVCLGTVADVAPLTGENRIFVRHGLQRLSHTPKVGLKALMEVADLRAQTLTTEHVGFILGPRINAAGRMSAPDAALTLLLTDDPEEATILAAQLHEENRLRQRVEETTLKEALAKVEREVNFNQHRVIVVHGEWHPGVIGIVAARLVERYYRPSIVVAVANGVGKGSARSVARFHLVEALAACQDRLLGFGGHEAAAGMTIAAEHLPAFREAINAVAHERLAPEALVPRLTIDAEISLSELTPSFIEALERLGPFGAGNPRPVFASHGLTLKTAPQLMGRGGLRCWVQQMGSDPITFTKKRGQTPFSVLEATGFDRAERWRDRLAAMEGPFSLAYTPVLRHFRGQTAVQLQIKDVQQHGA